MRLLKIYIHLMFIEKAMNNKYIKLWMIPVGFDLLLRVPPVSDVTV